MRKIFALLMCISALVFSVSYAQTSPTINNRSGSSNQQSDEYLIGLKRLGIPTSSTDNLDADFAPENTRKLLFNTTLNKLRVYNPATSTWADAAATDIASVTGLQAALDAKANNSDVVKLTGEQFISGDKYFYGLGWFNDLYSENGFHTLGSARIDAGLVVDNSLSVGGGLMMKPFQALDNYVLISSPDYEELTTNYTQTLQPKNGTIALTNDLTSKANLTGGNNFTGHQNISGGNLQMTRSNALLLDYTSLSETQGGASTILGNNVVSGLGTNTVKRTISPYDNGSFVSLNYYHGITFHTGINSSQNTEVPMYDSEKMRITQSGNVGIGTNLPTAKLDVNGDINLKGLPFASNYGSGAYNGIYSGTSGTGFLNSTGSQWNLFAANNGNVGVGTHSPLEKLSVNGKIRAREVKVEPTNGWPDYVFEEDYKPLSLAEISAFVKLNKHLPEVPSAKDIAKNGLELGEMNKLLLKKVEELTLHLIEKEKQLDAEKNINEQQGQQILLLQQHYLELKKMIEKSTRGLTGGK